VTNPFIQQLMEMCRIWPTRTKWVIVPSHGIGHTLGDRLVRGGTDWANLRFVTPLDLALRMAGPFLVERGIDPSEDTLGPALMIRLLLDSSAGHGYFRPVAEQPSMGRALWATLSEFRMAGLHAGDLKTNAVVSEAKHNELVALFESYERYLEEHQLADTAAVFVEAAQHLDFCPIQPSDCRIELPDTLWPVLHRRLLDMLPGERLAPRSATVPGLKRPHRLGAQLATSSERTDVRRDADLLRWLLRPSEAPSPRSDGSLTVFHAGGREAEIEEIFRRVLLSGVSLDEVEIACATEQHAALAWEKARRHGWPVTSAFGVTAASTRPGRALLAWCRWIDAGFDAAVLRQLLQSGDLNPRVFRKIDHPEPFSPGQAARVLLRAEAAWGKDTYRVSLERIRRVSEAHAADPDRAGELCEKDLRSVARIQCLLDWVEGVLAAIPEPDGDGQIVLRDLVIAAAAFLEGSAARSSALDAAALVALKESLAGLLTFGEFRCSLSAGLRFIRECVDGLRVGSDRARPGHLFLSHLREGRIAGRSTVFVAGLEEGRCFPVAIEDPVLLDGERRSISSSLATSIDRLDETVYAVVSRLATLDAANVCFSFSCRDTREFRETYPSWPVLHAWRLLTGIATTTFEDLRKGLGEAASCVPRDPDAALSETEWWLHRIRSAGARIRPKVTAAFPSLARGIEAARCRDSSAFTEFDGFVPAAGPLLDPTATGKPVSATTLERAAACPLRFFLQYGLGVQPVGEPQRQTDVWLDPLTRGSEMHAIFAAIMREVRDSGKWPPPNKFTARILELGKSRLNELKSELPPPSEDIFARESEEFLYDLELFMAEECARRGAEGVAFEVNFGSSYNDEGADHLGGPDPLAIRLGAGKRILLRGRIDRINQLEDGSYEVIDYKTGGFWRTDWTGVFAGGTRLQHALYGLAASELLQSADGSKACVSHSAYVFPTARGARNRVQITQAEGKPVKRVLNELCDVIGSGAFLHASDEGACKWCDFGAACGQAPATNAIVKLEASGNNALESYRRLREYE
jgi:ATP-dependent helicase/nuclease subunit B